MYRGNNLVWKNCNLLPDLHILIGGEISLVCPSVTVFLIMSIFWVPLLLQYLNIWYSNITTLTISFKVCIPLTEIHKCTVVTVHKKQTLMMWVEAMLFDLASLSLTKVYPCTHWIRGYMKKQIYQRNAFHLNLWLFPLFNVWFLDFKVYSLYPLAATKNFNTS